MSGEPSQLREPTNAGPIERAEELLRTIDSRSREITEMQNEAKKTYGAVRYPVLCSKKNILISAALRSS